MLSHGASDILKGKLMDLSDRYEVHVCGRKGCGLFAMWNEVSGALYCRSCKTSIGIRKIVIPYATKLLFQELMAMCIVPRIILDEQIDLENGDVFQSTDDEKSQLEDLIKEMRV